MGSLEPMVHPNKRYRHEQDMQYQPSGGQVAYSTQSSISNQRSDSDQTGSGSGSDLVPCSDQTQGPMSRSVSDSSLALSGPDSRSSSGIVTSYPPQYAQPEMQNQHFIVSGHVGGNASIGNGMMGNGHMVNGPLHNNGITPNGPQGNMGSFQDNGHSSMNNNNNNSNRGPPLTMNQALMMPHTPSMPPMHSGMNGGNHHMTNGPALSPAPNMPPGHPTNFLPPPPSGMLPPSSGHPPMYQPNGISPQPMGGSHHCQGGPVQAGFRPSDSPPLQMIPTLPSVPKWEGSLGHRPGAPNTNSAGSVTGSGGGSSVTASTSPVLLEPPCAACKSLRRKCTRDCIFLPYFPRDDPDKFARVHKVFGASNVSKMLQDLPVHQREDAVASLEYEAQARIQDPVFGCVGILCLLQKQIAILQGQVSEMQQGLAPRTPLQEGSQGPIHSAMASHQTSISGSSVCPPHS